MTTLGGAVIIIMTNIMMTHTWISTSVTNGLTLCNPTLKALADPGGGFCL
jgi:hypothetical protein